VIRGGRGGAPVLLDGAMGTALHARGLPLDRLPESWVVERPAEVASVHAAHVAAGARILLSCSFNLARLDVADSGLDSADVARRAVALARGARPSQVAGCVGATGLSGTGAAGPSGAELRERFDGPFRALAAAGVDLLWAETQLSLVEARAALAAARPTGLPVVVTACPRPGPGELQAFDGTPLPEFLAILWREGASAVGLNCVSPGPPLVRAVAALATRVPVPIVVKPNAGLPHLPIGPAAFAWETAAAVRAGATFAGGCCGAGPSHLAALRTALRAQARG
jgi:5-methyltetrahydrofolate--homocysteine methyltransferase